LPCIIGSFGRVTLYRLDKPMIKHVHREGHLCFWVGGATATATVSDVPYRRVAHVLHA